MNPDYKDIFLPENLKLIEAVYQREYPEAQERATKAAEKLSDSIDYYKRYPIEHIKRDIQMHSKSRYSEIKDEVSLKRAIEREYEERNDCIVPESVLDEIAREVSDETKRVLINKYKNRLIKKYIERESDRAEVSVEMFSNMTEQERNEYVALFEEMVFDCELFEIRRDAIKEIAEELDVEYPKCIYRPSPIRKKVEKIVEKELQDSEDISFRDKIIDKINYADDKISANKKPVFLSMILSNLASTCVSMSAIYAGASEPSAIATFFLTNIMVTGLLGSAFHYYDIKEILEDKRVVDEAKKLGLFDLSLAWFKATQSFEDYSDYLIDGDNVVIDGGEHGLY